MTQDEKSLIENNFKTLSDLMELRFRSLDTKLEETSKCLKQHTDWHSSLSEKMNSYVIKGVFGLFIGIVMFVLYFSIKGGVPPETIIKAIR